MKKFNKKKELKSEKVDSSELGKYYDEEVLKKAKKARRQKIWKIVQRVVIGVVASTVICSPVCSAAIEYPDGIEEIAS